MKVYATHFCTSSLDLHRNITLPYIRVTASEVIKTLTLRSSAANPNGHRSYNGCYDSYPSPKALRCEHRAIILEEDTTSIRSRHVYWDKRAKVPMAIQSEESCTAEKKL